MRAAAADVDELLALGDIVQRVPVLAQRRAVLVEIGDLQIGAALDLAAVGREFTQQQADQGGLAGTVRADDADPVAAHDAGREIAHQGASANRVVDVFGAQHALAGALRFGHFQPGHALLLAARGALAAQLLERAHAALVARAPGLDALADPHFFLRQLLVEQRAFLRLGVRPLGLAPQVVLVVPGPAGQLAAVDLDDARGQRLQEGAVVGNEHQRARELLEEVLQPGDRLDVEVIGRLVQQQDVRLQQQRLRQQHAPLHAAGQRGEIGVVAQPEPFHRLRRALLERPALRCVDRLVQRRQARGVHRFRVAGMVVLGEQPPGVTGAERDHVEHRAGQVPRHFLRHPRHAQALVAGYAAIVRRDVAGDQPQQRRLALAIAPEHADPLARFDGQVDMVQQRRAADRVVQVVEREEGHSKAVSSEW